MNDNFKASPAQSVDRRAITDHLQRLGYTVDRWGHLQMTGKASGKRYRIKLQALTVRFEVRSEDGDSWLRITSEYYGRCKLLPDGRLRIGSFVFPRPTEGGQ